MDPRLDENEAELGVLIFAVALEVLSDRDSLGFRFSIVYPLIEPRGERQTFLINMYKSSGISGARPGLRKREKCHSVSQRPSRGKAGGRG